MQSLPAEFVYRVITNTDYWFINLYVLTNVSGTVFVLVALSLIVVCYNSWMP